ncbi:DUF2147 domain-containing protein [uncultured Enterovirga sp.]|uniref:DUF2147 domain-containing protein n=1 Tax=uncultured Enterovirga sp. TaxID=2026352 RepID=UPI0035CBE7BA
MRHGLSAALALLGTALPLAIAVAAPKDPSGVWLTEDKRARVRVEKCGSAQDRLCGYIVWLKPDTKSDRKGPLLDVNNPDPKKAKRPVVGHQLILGLKANDDDQYEGSIYNADDGKTYDVTIWLEKPGDLKVKGCLIGFLCSTQSWTVATGKVPGQLEAPTGAPDGPRPDPEWATKATPAAVGASEPKRDAKPRS